MSNSDKVDCTIRQPSILPSIQRYRESRRTKAEKRAFARTHLPKDVRSYERGGRREEGGGREGARKQVRGKSRQRVQEETAAVTGSEVGSVNSKSQT